jgi:hypothetical protein
VFLPQDLDHWKELWVLWDPPGSFKLRIVNKKFISSSTWMVHHSEPHCFPPLPPFPNHTFLFTAEVIYIIKKEPTSIHLFIHLPGISWALTVCLVLLYLVKLQNRTCQNHITLYEVKKERKEIKWSEFTVPCGYNSVPLSTCILFISVHSSLSQNSISIEDIKIYWQSRQAFLGSSFMLRNYWD